MPFGVALPTDLLPSWVAGLWAQDNSKEALLLIGVAGLLFVLLPGRTQTPRDRQPVADKEVRRPTNTHLFRRWWWNLRPPHDLMTVDGLQIDRTRKPHAAWLGPTGAGKSTAVATVRVDGKRPTLIATPDVSDPLRAATLRLGGVIWTACESTMPINFLIGSPTEVAERLTEVFRSGGVGAWKRAARRLTADVIRDLDAAGYPRSLKLIGEHLQDSVKSDRELKTVCAGWVARFLDLADQFGSSIGTDGLDIADLLRQGKTVLLDNDAFDHASLGGDVVALGLAEAKRCASLVPGGFRLIFEEAGQLGERIDLAEPFHRAGRRRRIAVDDLTQAESDLNDGISANLATRIYFAQELKSLQRIAADRLGLIHTALDPANMHDFTAYICHGKIRRLVKFPKPPKGLPRTVSPQIARNYPPPAEPPRRRVEVIELARPSAPMLPPPRAMWSKYLDGTYRDNGCLRWHGKHDKGGYGYIYVEEERKSVLIHRWRWEQAYGPIGCDPETGEPLTVDHRATCAKDCSDLTHMNGLCTRGENSRRRWRVRGVSAT